MLKNNDLSRVLAAHPKVNPVPKMCYRNAARVVQRVPGYEHATYVEGIAVSEIGMLIEHGWVEHDGEILDPTLPDEKMAYFPGLRFEGREGLTEGMKRPKQHKSDPDVPIFFRYGWGGCESLEFCQAWDNAWAYVAAGGLKGELPPSMIKIWIERNGSGETLVPQDINCALQC